MAARAATYCPWTADYLSVVKADEVTILRVDQTRCCPSMDATTAVSTWTYLAWKQTTANANHWNYAPSTAAIHHGWNHHGSRHLDYYRPSRVEPKRYRPLSGRLGL
jgi:hypothetical protein